MVGWPSKAVQAIYLFIKFIYSHSHLIRSDSYGDERVPNHFYSLHEKGITFFLSSFSRKNLDILEKFWPVDNDVPCCYFSYQAAKEEMSLVCPVFLITIFSLLVCGLPGLSQSQEKIAGGTSSPDFFSEQERRSATWTVPRSRKISEGKKKIPTSSLHRITAIAKCRNNKMSSSQSQRSIKTNGEWCRKTEISLLGRRKPEEN